MSSFFSVSGAGRLAPRIAGLMALALLAAATMVGLRNYRAAHSLLEADPPSVLLEAPKKTGIPGLQSVTIGADKQLKLSAWYLPPTNGATVVVTHGTNSDRSTMLPELRILTRAGYGVLAFDWPGLGDSTGEVRWDGQARDALRRSIDWLVAQPAVDSQRIGGLGFSIGAFVMVQVAARDPRLRAVVLEAPPPDFEDYTHVHYDHWGVLSEWPARWAIRGTGLFDEATEPVVLVSEIAPRPVLFVGGTLDHEVPADLVSKLYQDARDPKTLWIVEGAGHGGYAAVAPVEFSRRIDEFFAAGLPAPPHSNYDK